MDIPLCPSLPGSVSVNESSFVYVILIWIYEHVGPYMVCTPVFKYI